MRKGEKAEVRKKADKRQGIMKRKLNRSGREEGKLSQI